MLAINNIKKCQRCKLPKDLRSFNICRSSKDGRQGRCRVCDREYNAIHRDIHREKYRVAKAAGGRRYYKKDPEKYKKSARESRARLRAEFLTEYGGICECCGESEPKFLTLEHKRRDGGFHRKQVGNTSSAVVRDLKKRGWPKDDYGILCFNCNLATADGSVCPHQRKTT